MRAHLPKINLAGYYCICDLILIWQWYYYRKYYKDGVPISATDTEQGAVEPSEDTPLLHGIQTGANVVTRTFSTIGETFEGWLNLITPRQLAILKYASTCAFVFVTGAVAYFTADQRSSVVATTLLKKGTESYTAGLRWDAQFLGWLSALLYLSSRVPQIFKNRHTKCAGLSLALFIFAVAGNVTYVVSILLKDMSAPYLIENASWLMGSLGTILLDFIVLYQFIVYAPERNKIESAYPHHL